MTASHSSLARLSPARQVPTHVALSALPRTWTWATFRNVAWWERREPTYGPLMQTQQ
jgi:hypothetical protein